MKIVVADNVPKGKGIVCLAALPAGSVTRLVERAGTTVLEVAHVAPYGADKKAPIARRQWIVWVRSLIATAAAHKVTHLVVAWDDLTLAGADNAERAQLAAENMLMAAYAWRRYRKAPKEGWGDVQTVTFVVPTKARTAVASGVHTGTIVAQHVNLCRDLANTPGGDMTPAVLAARVRQLVKGTRVRAHILMPQQIRRKRMGGVLGVAQGSHASPRFIVLEYKGAGERVKPVVLVGKGVTFDSGGLDVKPFPHAVDMMMDMTGGAAVIATILAAARLGVRRNIVVLVPAVENMPSGTSMRPGDVLTMMDGTTVEVRNTDAEGRLILADALCYARQYNPAVVIDVATLTGAALVALDERASAVLSHDRTLTDALVAAGDATGDYAWPLPLLYETMDEMRGTVSDLANLKVKGSDRYGGTMSAAAFLAHFTADFPRWAHIDIAPRMTPAHDECLAPGSAGPAVRLLVRLLSMSF